LAPDLDATGQTEGLGFIHRKLAGSDGYFVVNTSNKPIDGSIKFRSHRAAVQVWNPDSGSILSTASNNGNEGISLILAPYESRVFVLSDHPETGPATSASPAKQAASLNEELLSDLSGGWKIRFAGSTSSEELASLASWTNIAGKQYFSGEADYARTVTITNAIAPSAHVFLDFGVGTPITDNRPPNANGTHALLDPPIREAAIVFVNGKRAGSLWHPPYRIEVSGLLHSGENQIEVHVFNTAINLLSGQPPRDYSALYAKYGKRFEPQDMDNLQPIPSGLFGPIRLLEETAK
jgi:hypothetical protein